MCVFITAVQGGMEDMCYERLCVFITAVPITKLFDYDDDVFYLFFQKQKWGYWGVCVWYDYRDCSTYHKT